jgi:ABC-type Fe3+-siderophore transport system permease subunit
MFLSYRQAVGNPRNSLEAPSTLDMYALSKVYDWLTIPSGFSGTGHPATVYSVPPGTPYTSIYPYSEQIQTLQNSISQLRLEILIVAVVAGVLLAVALALGILLARKKTSQPQVFFTEPVTTPTVGQILQM